MTTTTSPTGKLNVRDFLRGLLISTISSPLTIIGSSIDAGHLVFNWKLIGGVAIFSGLSYLIKNLGSPGTVVIQASNETIQQVKDGDAMASIKQVNP